MSSRIPTITQGTYYQTIHAHKYAIIHYKAKGCGSCTKIYPSFEQLSVDKPGFFYAVFDINRDSKDFALNNLEISAVPTFDIYKDGVLVFRTVSGNNFHQFTNFIEALD